MSKELTFPDTVRYDREHEWIATTAPYRIGISDFAQDQLGDLTYVELPEVGAVLSMGQEIGSLESTKSASSLFCPLSGKVVAVNEALADDPGLLNADPYGQGWIFSIEPSDPGQLDGLMDASAYSQFVATESH